ncbi:MAG: 30S ribosomal protein S18 [Caldilineaceae bacterium]|nr:30S ribosomal protein S18 [Caldilineaceae bacterium]
MAERTRDEEEEVRRPLSRAPQRTGRPAGRPQIDDDDEVDDIDDVDDGGDDDDSTSYSDGPAVFARTKDGRRRNPRHVGNEVKLDDIDYKKVTILSRFVDNRGRIYSRRKTRVSAKMQRKVTTAIKRARHLALMPYTGEHVRITRKRGA